MRLAAAIAGVSFANVLVFFQMGLSGGLYDSQKRPIQRINGQLVMVSGRYLYLGEPLDFPRARLTQALGVEGVKAVTPLYIGITEWLNRDTRQQKQALIFGVTPENPGLRIPELNSDPRRCSAPTACCSTPAPSAMPGRWLNWCAAMAATAPNCAACGR